MSFGEDYQRHIKEVGTQIIGLLKLLTPVLTLLNNRSDSFKQGSTFISASIAWLGGH